MRRTKIICTLGPACRDEETLTQMLENGMNVARLNFSHQDHSFHRENIAVLKRLRGCADRPLALLLDTKGPEIRTGILADGSAELFAGERVTLTTRKVTGDRRLIPVSCPQLAGALSPGDTVLLDDGKIRLTAEETGGTDIVCRIDQGGVLGNTRGVNIPEIAIDMPFLSERDRADLLLGIEQEVDYVAASFVRTADDIRQMRSFLTENGGGEIRIIAKIECRLALEHFDEILSASDGIMVARGDLGVEVPFEQLPGLQKKMITRCYKSGKMAVTATQMLESMIEGGSPTRAEISDVANAVFDLSSAVMLSGETAIGKDPAGVVETMARICERAQSDSREVCTACQGLEPEPLRDGTDAVCAAAVTAAENIGAAAIIALTENGRTALLTAKYRPDIPILAATANPRVFHQLSANWGVLPLRVSRYREIGQMFSAATACALEKGLIQPGDRIVQVCGAANGKDGENLLKITEAAL